MVHDWNTSLFPQIDCCYDCPLSLPLEGVSTVSARCDYSYVSILLGGWSAKHVLESKCVECSGAILLHMYMMWQRVDVCIHLCSACMCASVHTPVYIYKLHILLSTQEGICIVHVMLYNTYYSLSILLLCLPVHPHHAGHRHHLHQPALDGPHTHLTSHAGCHGASGKLFDPSTPLQGSVLQLLP